MSAILPATISSDELLARFITVKHWLRSSDKTLRQDAFIPPKDMQLSTTRHIGLLESELWAIGTNVSAEVNKNPKAPLYGRADFAVSDASRTGLATEAAPLPDNPNHAHLTGWPVEKEKRKIIAQQLAASAIVKEKP